MFAARALRPTRLLRPAAFHTSALRCASVAPPDRRKFTVTDYTVQLMTAANSGHFGNCLQLAHRMKVDGIAPDYTIYNILMSFAARDRSWLFAWAIFDDMILAGIEPTPTTFAHLIQAQSERPYVNLWTAIDRMRHFGVKPTAPIYTAIIECLMRERNIETALRYLLTMKREGIVPELSAAQTVVSQLAEQGLARLAIDIAEWFEAVSHRRLDNAVWMGCLRSSAKQLYINGVLKCWPLVTNELNIVPTESVINAVINTAARHGHPDLATDALRVMQVGNTDWQDYHFAALIEAFCRNDQLKEAFLTIPIMKSSSVNVTPNATSFILESIKQDVETLDAAWAIIDEIHTSGQTLDIDSIKIVIEASIHLGDLQRAVGIYKSLTDYDLSPDLGTFNHLLDGCIGAQHRQLGDLLIEDMKAVEVKPDAITFEKMIQLCLSQEVYEDAFYYLEEMKTAGFVPPASVYEALLKKTLSEEDSRSTLVLEEMKECGYKPQDARAKTAAKAIKVNKNRSPRQ